jgi:hypothetical protein
MRLTGFEPIKQVSLTSISPVYHYRMMRFAIDLYSSTTRLATGLTLVLAEISQDNDSNETCTRTRYRDRVGLF